MSKVHTLASWILTMLLVPALAIASTLGADVEGSSVWGQGQGQSFHRPAPRSYGYVGASEEDFPPFQNFLYDDRVAARVNASYGIAHFTQRSLEARETDEQRPPLTRIYATARHGVARVLSATIQSSLKVSRSFDFYDDPAAFTDALLGRLEGKGERRLVLAIQSLSRKRQRHVLVYKAEEDRQGRWICTFFDPHLPADEPLRTRGQFLLDPDRMRPFAIDVDWVRLANRPDGDGEQDPFGFEPDAAFGEDPDTRFVDMRPDRVGMTDAPDEGTWDVEGRYTMDASLDGSFDFGVHDDLAGYTLVEDDGSWLGRTYGKDVSLVDLLTVGGSWIAGGPAGVLSTCKQYLANRFIRWGLRKVSGKLYVLYYDPSGKLLPEELSAIEQAGGDLGESVYRAVNLARKVEGGLQALSDSLQDPDEEAGSLDDAGAGYDGSESVATGVRSPAPTPVTLPGQPSINRQKQAGHVPGTPQNRNRLRAGKPTSSFFGPRSGDLATRIAYERGTSLPNRPNVREYDFGVAVGTGPRGGMQTRVRVHKSSSTGELHGHPAGREF